LVRCGETGVDMKNQPTIIGVSGRKRHGKDEIALALAAHDFTRVAFADELKRFAMDIWDLSFEQVYGSNEDKETVDERWGLSPRTILQQFGTQIGRNVHKETWVRRTFNIIEDAAYFGFPARLPDLAARRFQARHVTNATRWVIPDVRFPSEAEAVKAHGGVIIKVVRPSIVSDDMHDSEVGVDEVKEDYLIVNDGTLEDLRDKTNEILARILA